MIRTIALRFRHLFHKCLVLSCALLCGTRLAAQYNVTINLDRVPSKRSNQPIFVAGNFNQWQPGEKQYKLEKDGWGLGYSVELANVPGGLLEFKFTRGSWQQVNCTADGADAPNYKITVSGDTTINLSIEAWKDDFVKVVPAKEHTASPNVQLLEASFDMPQLQRKRAIWIYLPPGYERSKSRYPVMYLQDGQNLFDAATSFAGEWAVDETIDSLVDNGSPACIVVGIANGGDYRMSEYNPFPFIYTNDRTTTTFAAEGDAYLQFITETLKPYIDGHFRTLASKENSIIAGSSMGGLISFYAALKYPDVFGKAGIFSPAFWTAPAIDSVVDAAGNKLKGKYFFYMGGKEGADYLKDSEAIQEKIGAASSSMIYSVVDPLAEHNEAAWRKWFVEFYKWIMADGYNVITNRAD